MRYALAVLTTLAWALWLGGLVALFIFVVNLFRHDRTLAITAAPHLFLAFERFQLILAAATLIGTVAWRILQPRAVLTAMFGCFAVATVGAVISSTLITPKIMRFRQAGQTETPQFKKLHGQSMYAYTSEAVVLLAVGFMLPTAISALRPPTRKAETPAVATELPV